MLYSCLFTHVICLKLYFISIRYLFFLVSAIIKKFYDSVARKRLYILIKFI